jgi:hypothetical protein
MIVSSEENSDLKDEELEIAIIILDLCSFEINAEWGEYGVELSCFYEDHMRVLRTEERNGGWIVALVASLGLPKLIELIKMGAYINGRIDSGLTPLMIAAQREGGAEELKFASRLPRRH